MVGFGNSTVARNVRKGMKRHGSDVTVLFTIDEANLGPDMTMEKLVTLLDQGRFSPTDGPSFWVRNLVVLVISNWGANDGDAILYDLLHARKAGATTAAARELAEETRTSVLLESLEQNLEEDLERANISAPVRGRLPTRALFVPLSPAGITAVVRHIVVGTINALVPRTCAPEGGGGGGAPVRLTLSSVCDAIVACYDPSTGARYAWDAAAQIGTFDDVACSLLPARRGAPRLSRCWE
jgi:hypothetical protein